MQPVDLLGITIKTLAEIEKEVGTQRGAEQRCHESCVRFVVGSPYGKGLSRLSRVVAGG